MKSPKDFLLKMPIDLRLRKLAQQTVRYSVGLRKGETCVISGDTTAIPFLVELYKEIILQDAYPIVRVNLPNINDFFYKYAKEHQLKFFPQYWFDTVKQAQCYIGIHTETNTRELTSAESKKITAREKITQPISDYIVNTRDKIRRVTIAYPCISHAQEAEMSLTEWENFVYSACLKTNWKKFSKQLEKIKSRLKSLEYNSELPSIILIHDPKNVKALSECGVSLVLSGHTHGGQFFPFTIMLDRLYKQYSHGVAYTNNTVSITSYGVGTSMIPARIGTPSEIIVLTIQ